MANAPQLGPGQRRAAIYVRVSKNRSDDAAKPDRQIKSAGLLGKSKDLALVPESHDPKERAGVFLDDDISAYKGAKKRPAYEAMLDLVRAGEVDVVLCWHIDRMLRSVREMLTFMELAEQTGVSIESVQGGSLDLATPAGRMMATILSAVAQAEVELKAERHLLKNEQTRQAGGSTGGPVPFGWALGERRGTGSGRRLATNTAAKEAIADAVSGIVAGTTSLSQIARDWNQRGLTTTFGKPWNHNSVKKVLVRPRNAGLMDHKGKIIDGLRGDWEALVDEPTWRAARSILLAQSRPKSPRKHLLSNLITCEECGYPLVAGVCSSTQKGKKYNYDVYKHAPGVRGCGLTIRRSMVDHQVRSQVRMALLFGDVERFAPESRDLSRAIDLRAEIAGIEDRIAELEELWGTGDFSTKGYQRQRTALVHQRDSALGALERIAQANAFAGMLTAVKGDTSFETAVEIGERFDSLPLDHRKTIISTLFPRIEVARGRGEDRLAIYDGSGNRVGLEEPVQVS